MLRFLKWFFGFFSSYVHPFERKVDKFFRNVKSTDSISSIKDSLLALMQENLVIVSVWMEKKYKGYTYLSKSVRRKMYEDVEKIKMALADFEKNLVVGMEDLKALIDEKGLVFPVGDEEKLKYLFVIMQFLQPGRIYQYIQTASFGKLLRDPSVEKLEGDCNQIVTLYMYLYSLKYPLSDLNIKLLPEHVCLHFRNIDIEATNGTFQKYTENKEVLPATEIVSTNLLDLTDFREEVQVISPRVIVKSAQLAFAISSLKALVAKNLNIAYHNLAVGALKSNDFETAIFYLEKEGDPAGIKAAYHNGALYYLKNHDFSKARFFASKSGNPELEKTIRYNEGVYFYEKGSINSALKIFTSLGDEKMKKACYAKMYNNLVKKVINVRTLPDVKSHKSTYLKMLDLARKMGDSNLEQSVKETLSNI